MTNKRKATPKRRLRFVGFSSDSELGYRRSPFGEWRRSRTRDPNFTGACDSLDDCLDPRETYRRRETQMAAFGDRLGDALGIVGSRTRRILVWVRMILWPWAWELFEEVMDSVRGGLDKEREDEKGSEKMQPANQRRFLSSRFHLNLQVPGLRR
jgi:hypothetical protein